MKYYSFLLLLGLSLAGCNKSDSESEPAPSSISTNFEQDFTLFYQQRAALPLLGTPELTVVLSDLDYTYCPKEVTCIVGTNVFPTVSITDAQGQLQQLAFPLSRPRNYNPAWIDTVSFRANSRRYVLYYKKWDIKESGNQPLKKDISITLRVGKP